jgi:hypothetical protein
MLKEARKQVVCHERVLKLRLYYYYNLRGRVDSLWMELHDAIGEAVDEGSLHRHSADKGWVYCDGCAPGEVAEAYERKAGVYSRWSHHDGGPHLEKLVREAFRQAGYVVVSGGSRVNWRDEEGASEDYQLDVHTLAPLRLGIECKNKLSDVYISPDILSRPNDDHKQLARHFRLCHGWGLIPVLVAPLIDASFFGFIQPFDGLACRLLFQYLPTSNEELCKDVRREFLIGHVVTASEDDPPPNLVRWARRVPGILEGRSARDQTAESGSV